MAENPEEYSMVEEREELMVSPAGGNPFLRKAHFLKPTSPFSAIDENVPPFKLPLHCFSPLPSHFDPNKKWPLSVEFHGWTYRLKHWKTWVDQMASVHHSTWKKAGIYEAIINSTYQIRRETDLVYGLAEKWCGETNTFIFPWGEATISLEDVMVLGGYSVLGDSVLSPLRSGGLKEMERKLLAERKEFYSSRAKKAHTSAWMKKFMNSGHEFEHEAFLVCWLSRYVFNHNNITHKPVFSIAIHLARGTRIALAPAVLASIYRDLSLFKRKIVASNKLKIGDAALEAIIRSPFQLVQVWVWERFSDFRPKKTHHISYGEPRMARWGEVQCLKVDNLRRVLDSAGGDFKWRPYALHLPKCDPQKEILVLVGPDMDDELLSFVRCLRVCELVGLGTIEHYNPHRVAMQFGYDQDLPCSVTRRNHNSDRAWKDYSREIDDVKLYLPSRFFNAAVSTKYLKCWKKSVTGLEDAVPRKKKAKRIDQSPVRAKANHPLVPPGFPPKCNRMEAGDSIDEDELTVSEILKYTKNHESVEIRQDGDNEKLSGQVQNFASPISNESAVNTTKSDTNMASIVGNEGACSSSSFEKLMLEFQTQNLALKAKFTRLEGMVDELNAEGIVDELNADRPGTSYRKS